MGFFIPALIAGVGALAGALGNRSSKSTSDVSSKTDTTNDSTQNVDLSNMPNYTPEMAAYRDQILNALRNRFISGTDLSGYTTSSLQNINAASDLRTKAMNNILAARGLSNSPVSANALGRIESGRIGEQLNFMNSIPLLQRQLQGEDLDQFSQFFSSLPVGTRQTGTTTLHSTGTQNTTGTQTNTQPGNVLGGLFSGLGAGLAATLGRQYGANQQQAPKAATWGNFPI